MKVVIPALFLALGIEMLADRLHPRVPVMQMVLLLCLGMVSLSLIAWLAHKLGWKRPALLACSLGAVCLSISRTVPGPIVGSSGCKENVHPLCNCIDEYSSIHKKYPDNLNQLVPQILRAQPTCPLSPQGFAYTVSHDPENYTISCIGPHYSGWNSYNSGWIVSDSGFFVLP